QRLVARAVGGHVAADAARAAMLARGAQHRHRGDAEAGGAAVAAPEPEIEVGDRAVAAEDLDLRLGGIDQELGGAPAQQLGRAPAERALRRDEDEASLEVGLPSEVADDLDQRLEALAALDQGVAQRLLE